MTVVNYELLKSISNLQVYMERINSDGLDSFDNNELLSIKEVALSVYTSLYNNVELRKEYQSLLDNIHIVVNDIEEYMMK